MNGAIRYLLCLTVASAGVSAVCAQSPLRGGTASFRKVGTRIPHDTATVLLDTVASGISLPDVSDFKGLQSNEVLATLQPAKKRKGFISRFIDAFNDIDERYVERIGYNFTAMLQGTTNFEFYNIGSSDYAELMTLAQHPDFRIGPYLGWKWIFLGYSFDLTNIGSRRSSGTRFEFSVYTALFGIDFMMRSTGNDFFLKRVKGLGSLAEAHEGEDCEYVKSKVMGVNAYYNFNRRRFSCPAVFSQTAIQLKSAGSWQLGGSVTIHDVMFDLEALPTDFLLETSHKDEFASLERIKYWDYSVNFGYAYNWVPGRNWCVGMVLTPSLSYKHTSTQTAILHEEERNASDNERYSDSPFLRKMNEAFIQRGNFNFGATARLGVIYNNGRWFAGVFGVSHYYRYRRSDMRIFDIFGNANVCFGVFFQKKKKKNDSAASVSEQP